jgi:hypothetical protein
MCGCNQRIYTANLGVRSHRATLKATVPTTVVAAVSLPTVHTSIWGPPLWKVLHIAAQATVFMGMRSQWGAILNALLTGLPCPECTSHYVEWYRTHPLRFGLIPTRYGRQVVLWLLNLHNAINVRAGGRSWTVSHLDAAYGGNRLQEAKNALATLQGVIGQPAWDALHALLKTL